MAILDELDSDGAENYCIDGLDRKALRTHLEATARDLADAVEACENVAKLHVLASDRAMKAEATVAQQDTEIKKAHDGLARLARSNLDLVSLGERVAERHGAEVTRLRTALEPFQRELTRVATFTKNAKSERVFVISLTKDQILSTLAALHPTSREATTTERRGVGDASLPVESALSEATGIGATAGANPAPDSIQTPPPEPPDRAALEALRALVNDANRLCDRNQGGTYEEDCRRSIAAARAVLARGAPASPETSTVGPDGWCAAHGLDPCGCLRAAARKDP